MVRFLAITCIFVFSSFAHAQDVEPSGNEEFDNIWARYAEYHEIGDYEKSLIEARRGYELGQKLLPESDKSLAVVTFKYGDALLRAGDTDQSREILEVALDRFESAYGKSSIELVPVLEALAAASARVDFRQSPRLQIRHYKRAIKLVRQNYGKKSLEFADISHRAGQSIVVRSRSRDGQPFLQDAYDYYLLELGPQSPKTALSAFYLGRIAYARRKNSQAILFLTTAYDVFDSGDQLFESLRKAALNDLRQAYFAADRYDEFLASYGQAIEHQDEDLDYLPAVRVAPVYPSRALSRGVTGYVDLEFTVDENGVPTDIEVIESSSGRVFDRAAIDAVTKFRYIPRIKDGEAVAVNGVKTRISFDLVK